MKLNAKQLRNYKPGHPSSFDKLGTTVGAMRNPIYIIVDNVLDTYNIGSIFRLADAVAAEKVILCGESLTPPHTRIKKASINTMEVVPWEYEKTAGEAIRKLRRTTDYRLQQDEKNAVDGRPKTVDGSLKVIAIEQDKRSIPYTEAEYGFPVALIVGNESYGISKEVLEMCDEIVELPMWGINKSLNCMVSLGIVLYEAMSKR